MADELLSAQDAARRLGMAVTSLYDWLGQSDQGLLVIRGQGVTINYLQGGPQGQGRILIEVAEIDRIRDLMRVRPQQCKPRRPPQKQQYPGIHVKLGRPGQI